MPSTTTGTAERDERPNQCIIGHGKFCRRRGHPVVAQPDANMVTHDINPRPSIYQYPGECYFPDSDKYHWWSITCSNSPDAPPVPLRGCYTRSAASAQLFSRWFRLGGGWDQSVLRDEFSGQPADYEFFTYRTQHRDLVDSERDFSILDLAEYDFVDAIHFHCHPFLLRLSDGTLLAAFSFQRNSKVPQRRCCRLREQLEPGLVLNCFGCC
ncbi:hypothetical protein R1flu_011850 [Riccia fluitans]|uniref:Uncharacterized protein n=1 Tax=Riccia fluitans TaxID=41844 RepID=A0ABD1Z8Y7_9MARC